MFERRDDITRILREAASGDADDMQAMFDAVYADLRALAGASFRQQRAGHTLQPTALANEAYLRIAARSGVSWKDRSHFFALCGVIMRGILADHARRRGRAKRGGGWERVTLGGVASPTGPNIDLVALDEALSELAKVSERQSRVVEYRFFGGLTVAEAADLLGVSVSTAEDEWRIARAWLRMRLADEDARDD